LVAALALLACADSGPPPSFSALVFTRTAAFHHSSISNGIQAIKGLGSTRGFAVDATDSPAVFTDQSLGRFKVVIFLCTTGDVLDSSQQMAMERFIRAGGGFVGIHSASDTEYDWAWYGGLVGAYFSSHPAIQTATVRVIDQTHPSTVGLPATLSRNDEWYNFRDNPRTRVSVLVTLDETTYAGGDMGADHPISWYHLYDGGRAWYTAWGHTEESYAEPAFLDHLAGGILWAAGKDN